MSIDISTLKQLEETAARLTHVIPAGSWVYLSGELGTGKTAFSQRFIAALGYQQRVTSPTYAIMQEYRSSEQFVIHCDLYRLAEAEELYEIGLVELAAAENAIVLVEWAEKGRGVLPAADFTLHFELTKDSRTLKITPALSD